VKFNKKNKEKYLVESKICGEQKVEKISTRAWGNIISRRLDLWKWLRVIEYN
jgi:hypothetical protein